MDEMLQDQNEEELRRARAAKRRAELRKQKERQMWLRSHMKLIGSCVGIVCIGIFVLVLAGNLRKNAGANVGREQTKNESIENQSGDQASRSTDSFDVEFGKEDYRQVGDAESALTDEESALSRSGINHEDEAVTIPVTDDSDSELSSNSEANVPTMTESGMVRVGDVQLVAGYEAHTAADTVTVVGEENVQSSHAILIDETTGTIVAQKDAGKIINPASMTKILTVLVAAEHIEDLDDEVTIIIDDTDYAYRNDCSTAGFMVDEVVPVRDLFYGTILPSGGEAAIALATYVAGSEEAFVDMMNDKLQELGLSKTAHFTNCVGLYDEDHHCTIYDMAMILKAAIENDFCREVLTAHTYNTSLTSQHPEGILISNWFLRRIEDKDTNGEVLCAKTGFVNESGSCAASYEVTSSGTPYICVTADAHSSWRCIYDHVAMYKTYTK